MTGRFVERRFKTRLEIGKNLMSLGNLAAGGLIFGQAISNSRFSIQIAIAGLVALMILYTVAIFVMRGGALK